MGINNHQMRGIQDWVTARDHEQWSLLPDGMVAVNVSHSNLSQKMLELRFDLHQTIGEVKARLHLHHGTPAASQRLVLRDGGVDICQLDDDAKMLGFYNVVSGMEIHVVDVDPHSISRGGALENTALVEKYRMDDETYEQRELAGAVAQAFVIARSLCPRFGDVPEDPAETSRGDAAALDIPWSRRGCDVDIPWRRAAATLKTP